MSNLKELINYIEVLEAEPFTGWTSGDKKGYLTACVSIKKKAEKLLQEQATICGCGNPEIVHSCRNCGGKIQFS